VHNNYMAIRMLNIDGPELRIDTHASAGHGGVLGQLAPEPVEPTWQLLGELDAARDARRAEFDWRPKDDIRTRATVGGIAPPGSASAAHRAGADRTSPVRLPSTTPARTGAARSRIALRVLVAAAIVGVWVWLNHFAR